MEKQQPDKTGRNLFIQNHFRLLNRCRVESCCFFCQRWRWANEHHTNPQAMWPPLCGIGFGGQWLALKKVETLSTAPLGWVANTVHLSKSQAVQIPRSFLPGQWGTELTIFAKPQRYGKWWKSQVESTAQIQQRKKEAKKFSSVLPSSKISKVTGIYQDFFGSRYQGFSNQVLFRRLRQDPTFDDVLREVTADDDRPSPSAPCNCTTLDESTNQQHCQECPRMHWVVWPISQLAWGSKGFEGKKKQEIEGDPEFITERNAMPWNRPDESVQSLALPPVSFFQDSDFA